MKIKVKENKIYFDDGKVFGNIKVKEKSVNIELIKVLPPYRHKRLATSFVEYVLRYINSNIKNANRITLTPLPLDSDGLNIEQLISFYENFGFRRDNLTNSFEKYKMTKYLKY